MVLIVLQTTSPSHEHAGLIVGGPGAWRELPAGEAAPVLKEPALTDLGPRLKKPAAAVAKTPPEDVEEKEPLRPPPPPTAETKIAATTRRTHSSSSADPRGTVAYAITVTKDGPYVDVRSREKSLQLVYHDYFDSDCAAVSGVLCALFIFIAWYNLHCSERSHLLSGTLKQPLSTNQGRGGARRGCATRAPQPQPLELRTRRHCEYASERGLSHACIHSFIHSL